MEQFIVDDNPPQHQSAMAPSYPPLYNFPSIGQIMSFDSSSDQMPTPHKSQNGLMELLGHVSFGSQQQRQSNISAKSAAAAATNKRNGGGDEGDKQEVDAGLKALNDAAAAAARSSYMCRKCRAHGRLIAVRQHKRNCPYKHCNCSVCSLVNYGRHIVARQIALYRDQKNHGDTESVGGKKAKDQSPLVVMLPNNSSKIEPEDDEGPHCRRCRNHGKTNPWKGHKKACPFYYCVCQQCILITLRKSNEKNLSKSY